MVQKTSGTLADRYEHGGRLRKQALREIHSDLRGPADRDAVAILAATDRSRVPELVPVRYERMLASPFTFLRGAAAVMAEDLLHQPTTGIVVQACGDCHLMNFGAFATPEQNILFDINDFDETLPGVDFTADLKRLASSLAVAAFAANLSKKRARAIAATAVEAYRSRMRSRSFRRWRSGTARSELAREVEQIEHRALRRELNGILARARDHLAQDDNFPQLVKGKLPRIEDRPPLIYHFTAKGDAKHHVHANRALGTYASRLAPDRLCLVDRYTLKDVAFKVVGVGSVGTFCAITLYTCGDGTPLFLQIKEASNSVLERLGPKFRGHQGQRVVEGQRVMQVASDIFLGWTEDAASHRQFYVRQLKNRRLGSIAELVEEKALASYGRLCGRTLARAHARSGDPAVLAGYMGKSGIFDDALASFAMAYAARTQHDYGQLVKAKHGAVRKAA
jgi:uncharacterized protein (DUF2252 family)